jgi:tRNA/rRNA methyltransferase
MIETNTPLVVLVRPQLGENIGMAARAMANFGLRRLRLVSPRDGWSGASAVRDAALAAAAGADAVVEGASLHDTLDAALADCRRAYATTARPRDQAKRVATPAAEMPAIAAAVAAGERTALVFGPERTGLTGEEIARADAILSFPVDPAFPSLNLAQAVLLVAYEWRRASDGDVVPYDATLRSPPAAHAQRLGLFAAADAALTEAGFFRGGPHGEIMRRNFLNAMHRMALTEQDVKSLHGALAALRRRRTAASLRPR